MKFKCYCSESYLTCIGESQWFKVKHSISETTDWLPNGVMGCQQRRSKCSCCPINSSIKSNSFNWSTIKVINARRLFVDKYPPLSITELVRIHIFGWNTNTPQPNQIHYFSTFQFKYKLPIQIHCHFTIHFWYFIQICDLCFHYSSSVL